MHRVGVTPSGAGTWAWRRRLPAVTHEYTLLLGGIVHPGGGAPDATALAYAHDTVLAVGSDEEVRAISRGDSRMVDLGGRIVVPTAGSTLEPGAPATFRVLGPDEGTVAVVRDGRVVEGTLGGPGTTA